MENLNDIQFITVCVCGTVAFLGFLYFLTKV